ncbi:MAG: HD domain-containing protein [Chitinophagaceae bacterium]
MESLTKHIQEWMPQSEALLPFYQGMTHYLEQTLDHERHGDGEILTSKIFADPLLGYIYLTPLEVAIIDTTLYQRLRKIKQLGLANLVFPSLSYSRFEHSLGVVGRLNQILNKLIENYNRTNEESDLNNTIKKYLDSIRLAALMHDIGHCIFSHCSERVINNLEGTANYPSAKSIRQIFSKHFEKEKNIPFAELFSVAIIGSKHFADFVTKITSLKPKETHRILENCCRFILGLPAKGEPNTVFLSQLISSGLDADKIDYMMREQHYTGIKLEIDLDRILSKLNVFDLKFFELPKNLEFLKKQFDAEKQFKVLGFSKGGQFVFEEFCVARLALHVKVYLHQKVRAGESQLSNYLEDISKNQTGLGEPELQKAHNWLRLSESIVEIPNSINSLFQQEGLFNIQPFLKSDQEKALKDIDGRNLYCRAFAFGQINSFSEALSPEERNADSLENFFENFHEKEIVIKIKEEAKEIFKILDLKINDDDLHKFIIDIPRLRFKSIQQGQESLYFERPPLSPLKWTIPLDKIVIYFEENRALGYVFAERHLAPLLGLAAEKVVFNICGKVFSQEGNISKDTFENSVKLKRQLTERKYYQKLPELRDVSDYLKKADAAEKIKIIHEQLSSFESLKKERITINRITTFVNQFPIELQEACLIFLQQLEIYDERLLEEEVSKVIDKCPDKSTIGVAHLGGVSDSGGRLSYNLRELFEKHNLEAKEINDNLIRKSDVIIMYDDNINSGLQLLNIMGELLDELDKLPREMNLQEKHLSPLVTDEAKKKLKSMPLHFCFIVGFEGTEKKIKKSLATHLGFNQDNIHIHINKLFKNSEKIFNGGDTKFNHKDKLELKEFITNVGEQLLTNENKTPEKIESCKLGYAKAEAMVLFPYNIPTMTITALWCKGTVSDGIPWVPLAERRRRTKDGKFLGED